MPSRARTNRITMEQGHSSTDSHPHHPLCCSVRLIYAICAFFSMIMHLCMRNAFNFTILCMVKHDVEPQIYTPNNSSLHPIEHPIYLYTTDGVETKQSSVSNVLWTRAQEINIQATFYYGYVVTLPFAGRLADKYGGKFFFIHSMTTQAILFMLIPTFSRISYVAAFIVRLLQGLVAGFGNPSIYQLFSTWAHQRERAALVAFGYGGYSVGALIAFPLSALLCRYNWELTFYIIGCIALIFGISCHWLVYNTLAAHPRLSAEEREYLQSTNDEKSKSHRIPWKDILTCVPVYAFILTHVLHSFGIMIFSLMLPRFLKEALGLSISESGIYSSTPFLGGIISKFIMVPTCAYIEKRPYYKRTLFSKLFYLFCTIFSIIFLTIVVLAGAEQVVIINLCILFVGFFTDMGFSSGYWTTLLHLTPSYAGLLSGISNALSTINGFVSPVIIAALVTQGTKGEWNYVIFSLIVSYVLSAIIFTGFGSSKLQAWNKRSEDV
ncbi:sialin [Eurosta solidaginis]|uniref:sialin n=1 Tax=Eurosta solidaginis TaxID=178769 RepID=UPI00353153FB